MIKQIGEKWRGFWRTANNLALSMDADPLEDIHRRIKRLEAAVFQFEVGREPAAPSTSANPGTLREQTEHSRNRLTRSAG